MKKNKTHKDGCSLKQELPTLSGLPFHSTLSSLLISSALISFLPSFLPRSSALAFSRSTPQQVWALRAGWPLSVIVLLLTPHPGRRRRSSELFHLPLDLVSVPPEGLFDPRPKLLRGYSSFVIQYYISWSIFVNQNIFHRGLCAEFQTNKLYFLFTQEFSFGQFAVETLKVQEEEPQMVLF